MNTTSKKYFNYHRTNTDPNKIIKLKTKLFHDFYYKIEKKSPIKYNSNKKYSINFRPNINDSYNLLRNKYIKKNYSFSFKNIQKDFYEKKNLHNNSINNYFDNSLLINNNRDRNKDANINKCDNSYLFTTKPVIYESTIKENKKININLIDAKNEILDKNKNENLKIKFEHLLDIALKNDNNNNNNGNKINTSVKNKNNIIEIKKFVNVEKVIEKIRNKNRKILFKKKIELNMPHKRVVNVNNIKRSLNQKLFEKLNDSHLTKSINLNTKIKKIRSFKNCFMHLNDDIYYKKNVSNNNSYILNIQNIYRSNSKIDFNKRMINDENNKNIINTQNKSKIKIKLKNLKNELSFF
jgi:hypothetical protein